MPLTDDQLRAILALDWLMDPSDNHRRSGRSLAVAIVLIRHALHYPELDIHYMDHVPGMPHRQQVDIMQHIVGAFLDGDAFLRRLEWRRMSRFFRLVSIPDQTMHIVGASIPFPIWAWLPTNEILGDTEANLLRPGQMATLRGALEQEANLDEVLRQVTFIDKVEEEIERPSVWELLVAEGDTITGPGAED